MEGIWPLIIFAVVAMLFGGGKKKRPTTTLTPPAEHGDEPASGGLMGELNRALQELKRAEQEAMQRRTAQAQPPAAETTREVSARKYLEQRKAETVIRSGTASHGSAKGGELIKRKVHVPQPRPARPSAPARTGRFAPPPDDPDQVFEDPGVISLEGHDYDQDAERLVQSRIRAAELRDAPRRDASVESLSAAQAARRADRAPAEAIGGKAEHDSWHGRMVASADAATAAAAAASPVRVSPLRRFATGRPRDAIVLSEILGRPLGDR